MGRTNVEMEDEMIKGRNRVALGEMTTDAEFFLAQHVKSACYAKEARAWGDTDTARMWGRLARSELESYLRLTEGRSRPR